MQFTLRFLLLTFLLIALCLAVFSYGGLVIGLALAAGAAYARGTTRRVWITISVGLVLVFGLLLLLPTIGEVRRAIDQALQNYATLHDLKPISGTREVVRELREYRNRFGRLPPVQERDSHEQPMHSWRALVPQARLPLNERNCDWSLAAKYDYNEAWNGPNNRRLATEYPEFATWLAVVGDDGDWLRPTGNSNPVQVVEACGAAIRWFEPRDLTVDEACQAIHVPMPSGTLATRLMAHEASYVFAALADANELRIPVHTPPTILRAALLGDRTKQQELESYRDVARRPRWFDYLTLAGLVACWVAMIRALPVAPGRSEPPSLQTAADQTPSDTT